MGVLIYFLQLLTLLFVCRAEGTNDVIVLTVGTEKNHGLQRFLRSAKVYDIDVEVLGLGTEWTGGDMKGAGGGVKINLLKEKLESIKKTGEKHNQIILFTDAYDVIFQSGLDDIIKKFKEFPDTRVVFSAESSCWPDASLATMYPNTEVPYPFINSGGFIGYLDELLEILKYKPIEDTDDDQLYYTKVYLNKEMRDSLKISLDHNAVIFQNLYGAVSDIELRANLTDEWPHVVNTLTASRPPVIHGNGLAKLTINRLGNYIAKAWSVKEGCAVCKEKKIELKEDSLPIVLMAVFIEQPTPFLAEFLEQLTEVDYPKGKIHLLIRNNVEYHEAEVDEYFKKNSKEYATAKRIKPSDFITEDEARNIAKERCTNSVCDYLYSVDSLSRVEKGTLRYLLSSGYDVIAPMVVQPGQAWSNFWGAINDAGFYARAPDYMSIAYNTIRGVWNVPYIAQVYLVKVSVLQTPAGSRVTYSRKDEDPDMAFCRSLREAGIFMHVSNERDFGHLINAERFDTNRTHPDVYQVIDNKLEWEKRYLHEDYQSNFEEGKKLLEPCPDVFWFPMMSERFCKEWIDIMNAYGKWSTGDNKDDRLVGGYEAVPTRDIHMTQVGLERQWLHILKEYVTPLQILAFEGYTTYPPQSLMNFVVRYRPDEQPFLRPHFDSSSYTINLALNRPQIDYEGGGCRFIRYNCSVKDTRLGWLLMHPGRVTHYHEGLRVTNGTRYIMISFVDP